MCAVWGSATKGSKGVHAAQSAHGRKPMCAFWGSAPKGSKGVHAAQLAHGRKPMCAVCAAGSSRHKKSLGGEKFLPTFHRGI